METEVKEFKLQVSACLYGGGSCLTCPTQLETVQSSLQTDPDNSELLSLQTELEEIIALTEQSIAELRPAAPPEPSQKPAASNEKWSKEKHPAYQAGYRKPSTSTESPVEDLQPPQPPQAAQPHAFRVNDTVLARWTSGDHTFYPARIKSITGSSTNPIYIVTFKNYATTETLSQRDLKPLSNSNNNSSGNLADVRKRKASDGSLAGMSASNGQTPAGSVISAAADINPALASQARRDSGSQRVRDPPGLPKPPKRRVKANKELEEGKSKWQDFTSKGKFAKAAKKESMFRTGESPTARGQ